MQTESVVFDVLNHTSTRVNVDVSADQTRVVSLAIVLSLIDVATVIGNIFIITAVFQDHHLRNVTNYFIVSLAVADLLLGILILPFSTVNEILGYWAFGKEMCVVWAAVDVLCCTASILNLVAISWDRYLAISKPLKYNRTCTGKRAAVVIAAVWGLSVAVTIPPLFGWKREVPLPSTQCEITSGKGYVVYSALGSFFIPMIVMLILYSKIYQVAVRHTKVLEKSQLMGEIRDETEVSNGHEMSEHLSRDSMDDTERDSRIGETHYTHNNHLSEPQPAIMRLLRMSTRKKPDHHKKRCRKFSKEKRAAKTIAIVVGAFISCWFPFFTMYLLREICSVCVIPDLLFKCAFWLGYCNSFLNPIIYPCLNKDFKRAFRRIIRRMYCNTSHGQQYLPPRSVSKSRTNSLRVHFDIKTEVQTVTFEKCPVSGASL